jgi:integrase
VAERLRLEVLAAYDQLFGLELEHLAVDGCTTKAPRGGQIRILQLAEYKGAIAANPLRRVPPPKRRADPERVLGQVKRRAYTPEEAGRLLASCPLFWWDHVLVLLGTGLRFGEFAGLRRRRVHLERTPPVLQVVDVRNQAGRFGSGFKPHPKSDAGIREVPLAAIVVEAIRSQLPVRCRPRRTGVHRPRER